MCRREMGNTAGKAASLRHGYVEGKQVQRRFWLRRVPRLHSRTEEPEDNPAEIRSGSIGFAAVLPDGERTLLHWCFAGEY
jgi:hypothetical protein